MNHYLIRTNLAELKLGPTLSFDGNHVIPVIDGPPSAIAYRSLADSLRSGTLRIVEVSGEGSVPNLAVVNESDQPVLLLDGEEVAGAKQNRTLNTTILVLPRSKLVIPVSCTEAGRWSYRSPEFADSGFVAARGVRLKKNLAVQESLRRKHGYKANQGQVWDSIRELHADLGTSSPTAAMKDAFDGSGKRLDAARNAFPLENDQRGLIFIRDGRVTGLDVVSRPDVYADLHAKLISSFVIDTMRGGKRTVAAAAKATVTPAAAGNTAVRTDPPAGSADPEALAWAFVAKIAEATSTEHESVGVGTDIRFSNETVFGAGLVVGDEVVHLNAFPKERTTCPSSAATEATRLLDRC